MHERISHDCSNDFLTARPTLEAREPAWTGAARLDFGRNGHDCRHRGLTCRAHRCEGHLPQQRIVKPLQCLSRSASANSRKRRYARCRPAALARDFAAKLLERVAILVGRVSDRSQIGRSGKDVPETSFAPRHQGTLNQVVDLGGIANAIRGGLGEKGGENRDEPAEKVPCALLVLRFRSCTTYSSLNLVHARDCGCGARR